MWFCYILRNTSEKFSRHTYIGSTNNPFRRLRQHNEEIVGGARATHGKGHAWEIYALLAGFPSHKNALSCEWRLKHPKGRRKSTSKYYGTKGRIKGLELVLGLERWTKQCIDDNKDTKFKLWIVKDMEETLDGTKVPPNVEVSRVDKILPEMLELDKEKFEGL